MKIIILITTILLAGCATSVPVARVFPAVPDQLMTSCPSLRLVPKDTVLLTDIVSVVTDNYATFHRCQIQVEEWQQWYTNQKRIFEKAK